MTAMSEQKFAEFFAVMAGIYGHKWVSQYGTDPDSISARVWNDGLSGLSLKQIGSGVRHFKNHSITATWPPSLPEFRAAAIGIPSLAQAKHDLRMGNTTPFGKVMYRFLDGYVFKHASYKDADRLAAEAYELAVNAVTAGGEAMPDELTVALTHDLEARNRREKEIYEAQHKERMKELAAND